LPPTGNARIVHRIPQLMASPASFIDHKGKMLRLSSVD
jgi:hypothetical protein